MNKFSGIFLSIIMGFSLSVFAADAPKNTLTSKDYMTVKNILAKTGIPEQAIWKVADFEGDNVVRLDLSVDSETIQDPEGYNAVEYTVYSFTPFRSLPSIIGDLKSLRILRLDGNRITELPDEIGRLDRLEILSVNNNHLKNLPSSIGNLANLAVLNLKSNDLHSLPPSIAGLKNLRTLNLANNRLRDLGNEIGELSSLKYLYVQENPLRTLPPSIISLRLKAFDVGYIGSGKISRETSEWVKANCDEF